MFSLRLILAVFFGCVFRSALPAQVTFHKKADSLYAAYGLAVLPDSGYVLGGSWANCLRLLRLDQSGAVQWTQSICPLRETDFFESGSLQMRSGGSAGEFHTVIQKGSSLPGPDHVIDLMKFDAAGVLQWECQLPPYVSFGNFSSGSQLDITPDGTVWAVHGIGDTQFAPNGQSFNQVLLFKVSPAGHMQLRNSYKTAEQSTANGVFVKGNEEIYVYGGLGHSVGNGFLLKVKADGAIQWARQYDGLFFTRDGGIFENGDVLLYGQEPAGIVFVRLRPDDGSLVWAKKLSNSAGTSLYTLAADQGIFTTLKGAGAIPATSVIKIAPGAEAVDWARYYEPCTNFLVLSARATPDNGLVFTQNANLGADQTRLLKVDAGGQFSGDCAAPESPFPLTIEDVPVAVSDLAFSVHSGPLVNRENSVDLSPTAVSLDDLCPGDFPEAGLLLPDSVCADAPVQLEAAGNASANAWYWYLPGAAVFTAQGPVAGNVRYPEAGLFPVTLVQQYGLCTDTATAFLPVIMPLDVELFGFDDTLVCPDTALLIRPLAGDFDHWAWADGNPEFDRLFGPPQSGVFRLTVQQGLCSAADSFAVRVRTCHPDPLYAPNVFSPDGDQQNDIWEVFGRAGVAILSCSVYDRWGNLLYETRDGGPHWDGTASGQPLSPGVYLWRITLRDAEGTEAVLAGDVTLLR